MQKIKHAFTRKYISEKAEQLRNVVKDLEVELNVVEKHQYIPEVPKRWVTLWYK